MSNSFWLMRIVVLGLSAPFGPHGPATRPSARVGDEIRVTQGRRSELQARIGVIGHVGCELTIATPIADMVYAALLPADLKARGQLV